MKGKTSQIKRPVSKLTKRFKSSLKSVATLPEWVVGSYDGPKDKQLSAKEGYDN